MLSDLKHFLLLLEPIELYFFYFIDEVKII